MNRFNSFRVRRPFICTEVQITASICIHKVRMVHIQYIDMYCKGPWRDPGHSANGKAQSKWRSYKGALARQEAGGPGWLTKSTMKGCS